MSFTDHQITDFTHKLTDLPDQPNLSAAELKAYFDSSPEELRAAHNALAKAVQGITDATYPDTVTRDMLAPAVRDEIAGKAEQTALAAEAETRQTQIDTLAATKCDVYVGTYTGNASDNSIQKIELPFTPKMVFVMPPNAIIQYNNTREDIHGGMCVAGHPMIYSQWVLRVAEHGFEVCNYTSQYVYLNENNYTYYFFALA